jgi:hypothetical protein
MMPSGAIPPFLLQTDDDPEGVDGSVFDAIKIAKRRPARGVGAIWHAGRAKIAKRRRPTGAW